MRWPRETLVITQRQDAGATLYAAILREISDKGKDARFKKVDRAQTVVNGQ